MDKETQDAFKALGNLVTEGFKNMATKDDIKNMATKQDIESINKDIESIKDTMATKTDIKNLENKFRTIIREEVQDIRNAIEERCKPAQIEE